MNLRYNVVEIRKEVDMMKKCVKEILILLIQMFMFYVFPLFAGPTDAMGMVFLIILVTFILGIIMGCISKSKIKFLYPVVISILFIPSIFIYYNESALIHSVWYLVVSSVGLLMGIMLRSIFRK